MKDLFSVDDHTERLVPYLEGHLDIEATDFSTDALPPAALFDETGQVKPLPEGHLDREARPFGLEQVENLGVEEGAIHAESEAVGAAHGLLDLGKEIVQEGDGRLAVVDVTRAILHPQDLAGLGEIGRDGVVTGDLTMVGIEAAEGPLDPKAGRDDRAVDIDGERAKRLAVDETGDEKGVEGLEPLNGLKREVLESPTDRSLARQTPQRAEALEQSIAAKELDVTQPPATDDNQSQQQTNHPHKRIVARNDHAAELVADEFVEVDRAEVTDQKFKPGERRQPGLGELDAKIVLDGGSKKGFSISHRRWPFVEGLKLADTPTSSHSGRPFCNYESHHASIF